MVLVFIALFAIWSVSVPNFFSHAESTGLCFGKPNWGISVTMMLVLARVKWICRLPQSWPYGVVPRSISAGAQRSSRPCWRAYWPGGAWACQMAVVVG